MRKSAEYANYAEQLGEILVLKPQWWKDNRDKYTSDKQCEMAWALTEDGVTEIRLKMKMKSSEKEMNAIASHLRILEAEARNII